MQIKEGRCPNCGSILQLNAEAAKGHCLFCDAVFENELAFAIADDPSDHVFLNEEQPKYEGPNLDPMFGGVSSHAPSGPMGKKAARAAARQASPPAYVPRDPVKIETVKISPKLRLRILLIVVGAILAAAAITTPLVLRRDNERKALREAIPAIIAPLTVDTEKALTFRHFSNDQIVLALSDTITAQQAADIFKAVAGKRAELKGIDTQDFARSAGHLTMTIATPSGGYRIERPQSAEELSGTALQTIP